MNNNYHQGNQGNSQFNYNPERGHADESNPYYELPPNDEDNMKNLEQRTGFDTRGRKHIYYVYKDLETGDEKMSIMDDYNDFFDINHEKDNEYTKISKKFFIGEREWLHIINRHRRLTEEAEARARGEQRNDPVTEFTPTPPRHNTSPRNEPVTPTRFSSVLVPETHHVPPTPDAANPANVLVPDTPNVPPTPQEANQSTSPEPNARRPRQYNNRNPPPYRGGGKINKKTLKKSKSKKNKKTKKSKKSKKSKK